ncbi:MAG TPA: hypothetical protein VFJ15_05805 [Oleiagrimonas sp.]|nr:hypothetical protein [Oleiagrimonas sp.]
MAFRWLPDSEQYVHPRLSWLLQYAFDVVLHRMFRVDHDLPADFKLRPGTMIISNHLRDSDAPLLGAQLFARDGVYFRGALPYFAMREDLFQHGALANLLYACPRPWIHLLRLVSLNWLFGSVRTLPMRRLREFTWHDTLRELERVGLGSSHPEAVFNARGLRELRRQLHELPQRVDAINPWRLGVLRVGKWGLRRLTRQAREKLAPDFRATVADQLDDLARRLDAGHCLYFSPEGHVSLDGRFGRIRAGTWRLGRMTARPLNMLPLTLSYDPLGPGRTRAIVRMGDMLEDLDPGDPRTLSRTVRQTLVARRVVTPSHLLAQFLCVRETPFSTRDLVDWLEQAKRATAQTERELDPLFGRMHTDALVDERLRWLRRKHLVRLEGGRWHNDWDREAPPGWLQVHGIVRYLANALKDVEPELARALSS